MVLAFGPEKSNSVRLQRTSGRRVVKSVASPSPGHESADHDEMAASAAASMAENSRFAEPSACKLTPTQRPGQKRGTPLALQPRSSSVQAPWQVVERQ